MKLNATITAVLMLAVSALAFPASAQQSVPLTQPADEARPDQLNPAPPDTDGLETGAVGDEACRAQPEDNPSNGAIGEQNRSAQAAPDTEGAQDDDEDALALSDKLEDCEGVLTPPPTGETGMVAPPPDVGRTPVIPPGQLPGQQSQQPGDDS